MNGDEKEEKRRTNYGNNNNEVVIEMLTCQQQGGPVEGRPGGASLRARRERRRTGADCAAREAQIYQM